MQRRPFVFVLGWLALVTAPAPGTAQAPARVVVTVSVANVRVGAGMQHRILGRLTRGTIVELIESRGTWYLVRLSPELGIRATSAYLHHSVARLLELDPGRIPEVEVDFTVIGAEVVFEREMAARR